MKILKNVKRIMISLGMAILTFPTKIMAHESLAIQPLYGPLNEKPSTGKIAYNMSKLFIMPIIFLIGLLAIMKIFKLKRKTQIIVMIISIVIALIIALIIFYNTYAL